MKIILFSPYQGISFEEERLIHEVLRRDRKRLENLPAFGEGAVLREVRINITSPQNIISYSIQDYTESKARIVGGRSLFPKDLPNFRQ